MPETAPDRMRDIQLIRDSRLLDPKVFMAATGGNGSDMSVPPELLYLQDRKIWGRATSALFDGAYYLDKNSDIQKSGMNPLLHYLRHGYREGRNPSLLVDIDYIMRQLAPVEVAADDDKFKQFKSEKLPQYSGIHELLSVTGSDPSFFFDNDYYRTENGDVIDYAEAIPLEHYMRCRGRTSGGLGYLECTSLLSLRYYMAKHADLVHANVIPLLHLVRFGLAEGRKFCEQEKISKAFLLNTAALFADEKLKSIAGFMASRNGQGHLAGPFWPTPFTKKSISALVHEASNDRKKAFVGIVLYENTADEISRLQQSIDHEINNTPGYQIEYCYLVNDSHNEERYRSLLGDKIRFAPDRSNVGFGRGHNLLMQECFRQDQLYIAANPDGYFAPGCIKRLVDFSDFYNDYALIEASALPIDHPKWHDPITLDTQWVSGACFAMSRKLWSELNGFDEKIHMYCEDVDLSWRVKLLGGHLKVCPTARFIHDVTPRFVKQNDDGNAKERRKAMLRGAYYLAKKWGNAERARRLKSQLVIELGPAELETLVEPSAVMDSELANKISDFSHERFAPSRFWGA